MKHVISSDTLSVALDSQGGSFTSIKAFGREYLWQGDPSVWSGQAPICFPICGGLRDGRAVTEAGVDIELPRHGFARKQDFRFVECGVDHATLELVDSSETLAGYPFPFKLTASYLVKGNVLSVTYAVTNTGKQGMPFFIGGHPGFRCPLDEGERFEDYIVRFEVPETETVPFAVVDTGLIDVEHRSEGPQCGSELELTHDLFEYSETIYDRLQSRSVRLVKRGEDKGVRITFSDLPYLIIWSKPAGDFVAIEPWGGLSTCSDEDDVFERKRGCLIAQPGETVERGFTIEVM